MAIVQKKTVDSEAHVSHIVQWTFLSFSLLLVAY